MGTVEIKGDAMLAAVVNDHFSGETRNVGGAAHFKQALTGSLVAHKHFANQNILTAHFFPFVNSLADQKEDSLLAAKRFCSRSPRNQNEALAEGCRLRAKSARKGKKGPDSSCLGSSGCVNQAESSLREGTQAKTTVDDWNRRGVFVSSNLRLPRRIRDSHLDPVRPLPSPCP